MKNKKAPTELQRPKKELTIRQKLEIISLLDKKTQKDLAKQYDVSDDCIFRIKKNKEKIAQSANQNIDMRRIIKTSKYDVINEETFQWFSLTRKNNIPITGVLLQETAQFFALKHDLTNFKASNGWLETFKSRNKIKSEFLFGESKDADYES